MEPAREIFELQALEIIYLAALTGETGFPGLAIDLEAETENRQRTLMNAQMRTLEAKGYLEIDFMGVAKVNEVLHQCIAAGANSTSYLCQLVQNGDKPSRIYYFHQGNTRFQLEHLPETDTYILQELYAQHEMMFQVIERIPLLQSLEDEGESEQVFFEEPDLKRWAEGLLHAGASLYSLAEIACIDKEAQVIRELNLVIDKNLMWMLQREPEEEFTRDRVALSMAIEELCLWLQAE
ncbi:hypothetical protein MHH28_32095 [Paenibacillus sp. FSL K6-1217]|uniref:hypothetical protein n=1 Tax=Paenibacillus sp. FSL K6-1217 TaxID=2921466 RepID=UPI003246B089